MIQFRSKFKTSASFHLGRYFSTVIAQGGTALDIFVKQRNYIYPTSDRVSTFLIHLCFYYAYIFQREPLKNRPYQHSLIVDILKDMIGTQNSSLFQACLSHFAIFWQGDERLEVSKSMVAIAATAVGLNH